VRAESADTDRSREQSDPDSVGKDFPTYDAAEAP
jgi:hypothetical protein